VFYCSLNVSCYTVRGIVTHSAVLFMDLETLLKKREAYAGKILTLGIQIAGIFLIPVILVVAVSKIFNIPFIYLFPVAFITSWVAVAMLYRKYSTEVKEIDRGIRKLREKEEQNNNAQDALQK